MDIISWFVGAICLIVISSIILAGGLAYIQYSSAKVRLLYVPTEKNRNLLSVLNEYPYKPLWYMPRYTDKTGIHTKLKMTLKCDMTSVIVGADVKICAAWFPKPPPKDKTKLEQKYKDKLIKRDVLLVLIPGFAGSQNSWGIAQTAQDAFESFGWRSVVYNRPGYGVPNCPNEGEEKYCLHRLDFLEQFVRKVKADSGASKVVLLAHSLGGLNAYMGLAKYPGLFDAAMILSPILDPTTNYRLLDEKGDPGFRNWRVGIVKSEVSRWIKLSPEKWQNLGIDMELVNSIKGVQEFDEKVVAKSAGISSLAEYYNRIGNVEEFAKITTPTLLISSSSDRIVQWAPVEERLKKAVTGNPNVIWAHYRDGGHVEFPMIRSAQKGIECWANIAGLKFLKLALETAES